VQDRDGTRIGDLRRDRFDSGYDLVLLYNICHMLPPEENRDLIRHCRETLDRGGRLVIQDLILSSDKTAPRHAALFSLNMRVGTDGGASYSMDEYGAWMREAGFDEVRLIPLPGPASLVVGTRRG
jgi:SAM-dependent methyltransferase